MKSLIIILLLLLYNTVHGQELSGTWRGNYGKSLFTAGLNKLEIDIEVYNDSLVRGSSHLYYGGDSYKHYMINGWYRAQDSTIYFSEDEEIDVKPGMPNNNVKGNYLMQLKVNDTALRFEGKWKENSTNLQLMATNVWLEKPLPRKRDTPQTQKPVIKPAKQPDSVKPIIRQPDKPLKHFRTIFADSTEQDSIRIEITDNARVDNDIISLLVNGEEIIHHQTLTKNPIVVYVSVSKEKPECIIQMKAESYGSMPPCTARMSIITSTTSYAVDVESNYQYTGSIAIKLLQ